MLPRAGVWTAWTARGRHALAATDRTGLAVRHPTSLLRGKSLGPGRIWKEEVRRRKHATKLVRLFSPAGHLLS